MQRRILLGRPQVGDQQLLAAEEVERQEAVVVVIAAEVPTFLMAMNDVVRGIEIENQFGRRLSERGDELLDQDALRGHHGLSIGPILETAQRRA